MVLNIVRVPIKGDGSGAECTITTTNDQQVDSIVISKQGSGYTYGSVDLEAGRCSYWKH